MGAGDSPHLYYHQKGRQAMNNATAIHELNRAAAEFRARQDEAPTAHSAREIAQMDVLSEFLHQTHTRTLFGSLFGSVIDSYDPDSLPIQVGGATQGRVSRDGRGVERSDNIHTARLVYPDLRPRPDRGTHHHSLRWADARRH